MCCISTLCATELPPPIVIPKDVNLTVVVTDAASTRDPLIDGAKLTAYVADEKEGMTTYAAALTGVNGIAKIPVPHNKSVMIGVEHRDYLSRSESYKAYLSQSK